MALLIYRGRLRSDYSGPLVGHCDGARQYRVASVGDGRNPDQILGGVVVPFVVKA